MMSDNVVSSTVSGGSRGRRLGQLPRAPREGAPKRREEQK